MRPCVDDGAVLEGMRGVIGFWIHRGNLENGDFICNGPIIGWPSEGVMRGDDVISLNGHTLPFAFAFFLCCLCVASEPRSVSYSDCDGRTSPWTVQMPYVTYAVGGGRTHLFSWRRGYLAM